MRVAIFTDSYRPYTSGVVRSIETFSEELLALGHQVYIFAPRYGQVQSREETIFRFYSVPSPTNPDYNIAIPISLRLKATLKQLKVNIIHVHSPFMLGRLGARCARDLELPLVFTYHTLYDQYVHYIPVARNLTRKMTQKLSVQFCNRCDMVLVPTWVIGEYIRGLGVQVPVTKLPSGIKVEDFQQGDPQWLRERYGIGAEEKVLLFVGRLGQEKNIEFLLRAYRQVLDGLPQTPVRLVLVGGGPETGNLKLMAQALGIAERTVFTGPLAGRDVVHCYAGADLFVFPSVTETQGLVIGEAKAAGVPAVAVDAFGVAEMVSHGEDGFLTSLSEQAFSEKILLLLNDEGLRRRMASTARENARELSAKVLAGQLENVYRRLIEHRLHKSQVR
ncbi:glycosyltransferase family 4 protein [Candidatus Desulforudis audaxviator]|uniref:Glycosyl transferase, group 1 n=1 Tax=Desulforudis audaxviator (strain MP104C) TaxID=477974 RepID=B1I3R0_DESAP|nr:glycosyltransferase family 4 protein [Candidatus Desulforudis audaxviator]ACA59617.1 glycosyl transferase, group 1 [Candidatus Desulforudis audaxviator MP104C]AZK59607.1 Glycosyltransferase [Candidatus Desulforudis audaxviator]